MNNNKGFINILVTVIIVVVIGVVGYFAITKKSEAPTGGEDTASWQTYQDIGYGMEFKYPDITPNSIDRTNKLQFKSISKESDDSFLKSAFQKSSTLANDFVIDIYSGQFNCNNDSIFSKYNNLKKEEIKILGNLNVLRRTYFECSDNSNESCINYISVCIPYDSIPKRPAFLFDFFSEGKSVSNRSLEIVDHIFKTLKFTN